MSAGAAAAIRAIDGVERTAGVLLDTMSLEEAALYGVPTMGVRADSWLLEDYRLTAGRRLSVEDGRAVLIGFQLARQLGQGVGEDVVFYEDEIYEIVGIFESYSTWENGSIVMPLEQLQRLTDRTDQVTYVNVVVAGPPSNADVERIVNEIGAIDDRLLAMPTEDFVKTDTRMRLARAMAWMTSSIALLIGAIGLFNTMLTSIYERTSEIGVLRAIGWRQSRVVRMILAEAGLLSVAAAIGGSLGGILVIWGMSRAPVAAGTISPLVSWEVIAQGVVIAMVIGLLGAAYPAYRAARLVPTEALRHE
jgi:putative ABC transport system permease protein